MYRVSETVHEGLLCSYVYNLSVTHFGDFAHIDAIPIELSLSVTVTAFVGAAVQVCTAAKDLLGTQLAMA